MRIPRVLGGGLAAAVCLVAGLAAGPGLGVAGADCSGPQLTVTPTTVAPGAIVTVAGTGFGDDCNDTGRRGVSPLGQPLQDIELRVRVGGSEKLVARVDAGPAYDFAVPVVVPPSLGPGSGVVTAEVSGIWVGPASAPFVVEGPPLLADDPAVVDLPPRGYVDGVDVIREERGSSGSALPWLLVGAVAGGSGVLAAVALARRRAG